MERFCCCFLLLMTLTGHMAPNRYSRCDQILVNSATQQAGRVQGSSLRITLEDAGRPITDADVVLEHFKDEACAKLFVKKVGPHNRKEMERLTTRLRECSQDLPWQHPDEQGQCLFNGLEAGWYALRLVWDIRKKPNQIPSVYEEGGFVIGVPGIKDNSGKYDAMAQGRPFYFSASVTSEIKFSASK